MQADNFGVEFTYLALGQSVDRFSIASTGSPILARPFFDVDTGAEDAHLIAYPNLSQGSFSCSSTSDFQAAEILARWAIARCPGSSIELLAGYRFQQLTDRLDIGDTAAASTVRQVRRIQILDQFHTRNDFNGAELGFAIERHQGRWSLESNVKLAAGQHALAHRHQRLHYDGRRHTSRAVCWPCPATSAYNIGPVLGGSRVGLDASDTT